MKTLEHEIRDVLNRNKNKDIQIDIVELFQMVQEEYFNNFLTEETYEEYEHDLFVQCYFESLEDIFEQAVPQTQPQTPRLLMPTDVPDSTQRLKISQKAAEELVRNAANQNVKQSLARKIAAKIGTAIAKRVGMGAATGAAAGAFTGPGATITAGVGGLVGLGLAAKDAYDIYKDVMRQPKREEPPPLPTRKPKRKEPQENPSTTPVTIPVTIPSTIPKPKREEPKPKREEPQ